MRRLHMVLLVGRALWELTRYDALFAVGGFARVRRTLGDPTGSVPSADADCRRIIEAMDWAIALYWKPVLCLQNAIVTARLLRRRGFEAEVVIGCRPEPFFSHAWVEVEGRVVNDSPAYRQQLPCLARF
jgi:Transglutaminase-like superfamily